MNDSHYRPVRSDSSGTRLIPLVRYACVILLVTGGLGGVSAQQTSPRGYYLVHSNIDGASVTFDTSFQGVINQGTLLIPVQATDPRFSIFTVQKEGYESYIAAIPRFPGKGETVDLYATLGPIPAARGSVYIVSDPPGAGIYLDGKYQGTSPVTIENVQAGSYTIEAMMGSYSPFVTQVTVFAGKQAVVNCQMEAIIGPGTVMVTSTPSGAKVAMDGLQRGTTPLTIPGVAPIDHVVEVDMDGFFGWTGSVQVKSGSVSVVNATLKPVTTTATGWILVDSVPAGADVYLNGEVRGMTPGQGSLTIEKVPVGEHVITLRLGGYDPLNIPVSVKPAEIATVNGVLITAGNLTAGAVSVASNPPGADLFIDNVFRGVTPVSIGGIVPGDHSVMVRKAGYQDSAVSIMIPGGRTIEITIPMSPISTPTTRESSFPLAVFATLIIAIIMARKIW